MTVMRRKNGWAFAASVADGARGRRQVWRGGFRTKAEAAAAERRFLVELETASAPARPSMSCERVIATLIVPHVGEVELTALAPAHIRELHTVLLAMPKRWGSGLLSPTIVRMAHRVLHRAMQDALRWELAAELAAVDAAR